METVGISVVEKSSDVKQDFLLQAVLISHLELVYLTREVAEDELAAMMFVLFEVVLWHKSPNEIIVSSSSHVDICCFSLVLMKVQWPHLVSVIVSLHVLQTEALINGEN